MFTVNTRELKVIYNALNKYTEGNTELTNELRDRALSEYNKQAYASEAEVVVEEVSTVEVKEEVKTEESIETIEEAKPKKTKAKKA